MNLEEILDMLRNNLMKNNKLFKKKLKIISIQLKNIFQFQMSKENPIVL